MNDEIYGGVFRVKGFMMMMMRMMRMMRKEFKTLLNLMYMDGWVLFSGDIHHALRASTEAVSLLSPLLSTENERTRRDEAEMNSRLVEKMGIEKWEAFLLLFTGNWFEAFHENHTYTQHT